MKAMPARRLLQRLFSHLRPFRVPLVLVIVLDLLSIPITLLTPLPLAIAVDHAVSGKPLPDWALAWLPSSLANSPAGTLALAVALVVLIAVLGQLQRNGAWVLDSPVQNALNHFVNLTLFLLGPSPEESALPVAK